MPRFTFRTRAVVTDLKTRHADDDDDESEEDVSEEDVTPSSDLLTAFLSLRNSGGRERSTWRGCKRARSARHHQGRAGAAARGPREGAQVCAAGEAAAV